MADEYRLSYTGQQVDEAIGKALTGLPTITIALSQVISQSPLQIQLTNEQYATMNGRSVILDASALGMPVVVADYNGQYTDTEGDNPITYLTFIFPYNEANEYLRFNRILVNVSTKVAKIRFDDTYPYDAVEAKRAKIAYTILYDNGNPNSDNPTNGTLGIVVLSSDPPTKREGYLYIITGSN